HGGVHYRSVSRSCQFLDLVEIGVLENLLQDVLADGTSLDRFPFTGLDLDLPVLALLNAHPETSFFKRLRLELLLFGFLHLRMGLKLALVDGVGDDLGLTLTGCVHQSQVQLVLEHLNFCGVHLCSGRGSLDALGTNQLLTRIIGESLKPVGVIGVDHLYRGALLRDEGVCIVRLSKLGRLGLLRLTGYVLSTGVHPYELDRFMVDLASILGGPKLPVQNVSL